MPSNRSATSYASSVNKPCDAISPRPVTQYSSQPELTAPPLIECASPPVQRSPLPSPFLRPITLTPSTSPNPQAFEPLPPSTHNSTIQKLVKRMTQRIPEPTNRISKQPVAHSDRTSKRLVQRAQSPPPPLPISVASIKEASIQRAPSPNPASAPISLKRATTIPTALPKHIQRASSAVPPMPTPAEIIPPVPAMTPLPTSTLTVTPAPIAKAFQQHRTYFPAPGANKTFKPVVTTPNESAPSEANDSYLELARRTHHARHGSWEIACRLVERAEEALESSVWAGKDTDSADIRLRIAREEEAKCRARVDAAALVLIKMRRQAAKVEAEESKPRTSIAAAKRKTMQKRSTTGPAVAHPPLPVQQGQTMTTPASRTPLAAVRAVQMPGVPTNSLREGQQIVPKLVDSMRKVESPEETKMFAHNPAQVMLASRQSIVKARPVSTQLARTAAPAIAIPPVPSCVATAPQQSQVLQRRSTVKRPPVLIIPGDKVIPAPRSASLTPTMGSQEFPTPRASEQVRPVSSMSSLKVVPPPLLRTRSAPSYPTPLRSAPLTPCDSNTLQVPTGTVAIAPKSASAVSADGELAAARNEAIKMLLEARKVLEQAVQRASMLPGLVDQHEATADKAQNVSSANTVADVITALDLESTEISVPAVQAGAESAPQLRCICEGLCLCSAISGWMD